MIGRYKFLPNKFYGDLLYPGVTPGNIYEVYDIRYDYMDTQINLINDCGEYTWYNVRSIVDKEFIYFHPVDVEYRNNVINDIIDYDTQS